MRKNLTEIVFILDRSGSMSGLEADTIGGFNSMIEKQKKAEGEALISTCPVSYTHLVVVALLLFSIFSRIFIENGTPNYFLIWLACGVPFGIGKMFTLIPVGFGISGTVGVVALNLSLIHILWLL